MLVRCKLHQLGCVFNHLSYSLTLGSSDKGGEAFK